MSIKPGQLITLEFEDREFEVIVIDPNGLGHGQPSVGFGLAMMERHGGLPTTTAGNWVQGFPNTPEECLKAPSGKTFRVSRILGEDNNQYVVFEVSDWVSLAADVLKAKGKVKKSTLDKLIDFLTWFAVKGFYAEAYAKLKGAYTEADSRAVLAWMKARLEGFSGIGAIIIHKC